MTLIWISDFPYDAAPLETFQGHLSLRLIVYPCSGVRPSSSVHNVQTSAFPKPLGQSKPNFVWSLYGSDNNRWLSASGSHNQDDPIYNKNPSKISGTSGPISTKFGMLHKGLGQLIVCSNDDPRLTFTYFTAMSYFGF